MTPVVFYEVYPKRALVQSIDTLPLLDRDTAKKRAIPSAMAWGGVVVRVVAEVVRKYPLQRQVLAWEVVWVHKPRRQKGNGVTHRKLMGKIRANDRTLYKKWDL